MRAAEVERRFRLLPVKRIDVEKIVPVFTFVRWRRSGVPAEELDVALSIFGLCGEELSPHGEQCKVTDCTCDCHLAGLETVDVTRWRGLVKGDKCRIRATHTQSKRLWPGVYTFVRYHRDPNQEFVEVTGPKGESRSVRPEQVNTPKGGELLIGVHLA